MFINIAHAVEAETKLTYTFPGMKSATVADPGAYIYEVFTFALGIVGLAALAFLVYGGIRYILSAGNPSALADAKDRMLAALIGIVLLLSSYLILNTIDPRLLELTIEDIQPVTPGQDIRFEAAQLYIDDIADAIQKGNTAAAKEVYAKAKQEGVDMARRVEGELSNQKPEVGAALFAALDLNQQTAWILRATQNRPGSPGYDPSAEYYYSSMIQRVPVNTLIANYWKIPPKAQQEFLGQLSDPQRASLYWKFRESGGAQQQESYMSQLSADHLARIYQNLQTDGVHGAELARQMATMSRRIETIPDGWESTREIIGVWKRLRPGAERELFIKQVKQAGGVLPEGGSVIDDYLRLSSPGTSDEDIMSYREQLRSEFKRQ